MTVLIGLLAAVIFVGIIAAIIFTVIAYAGGAIDRHDEVRYPNLYKSGNYKNIYFAPYNYIYDLGYASYDKRKLRADSNKLTFKRK